MAIFSHIELLEEPRTSDMMSATWSGGSTPISRSSAPSTEPRSSMPFENSPANSSTRSSTTSMDTAPSCAAERVMSFSSAASKWPSRRLASGLPITSSSAATFSALFKGRGVP